MRVRVTFYAGTLLTTSLRSGFSQSRSHSSDNSRIRRGVRSTLCGGLRLGRLCSSLIPPVLAICDLRLAVATREKYFGQAAGLMSSLDTRLANEYKSPEVVLILFVSASSSL